MAGKGNYVASGIDFLLLASEGLGTLNVRCGLAGNSGKLEALVQRASRLRLGVVGLQETATAGEERRVSVDAKGDDWTLCTGGSESSGPRRH